MGGVNHLHHQGRVHAARTDGLSRSQTSHPPCVGEVNRPASRKLSSRKWRSALYNRGTSSQLGSSRRRSRVLSGGEVMSKAVFFRLASFVVLTGLLAGCGSSEAEPAEPPGGLVEAASDINTDDLANLGPSNRFLFWEPEQQVAGYRNIDRIFPTRTIHAGGESPFPLRSAPRDLSHVKDGEILLEHYGLRAQPNGCRSRSPSRWSRC